MTKIGILDVVNGTNEVRDMTKNELADYQATIDDVNTRKAELKAQKEAAEAALLGSLGITKQQAIVLGLLQPDYVKPNLS